MIVRPWLLFLAAGCVVAAVLWGWAVAQYPFLLPRSLTIEWRLIACRWVGMLAVGPTLLLMHLPIERYWTPEEFASLRDQGMTMGFRHVESGPLVRSSYHAERHVGLG